MLAGYVPVRWMRQNARWSLIDGVYYSVMMGLTNPFMGVFAIYLGASDFWVGLLGSLPALANLVSFPIAAAICGSVSPRGGLSAGYKRVTLVYTFAQRLFYLVFAVLPWLDLSPRVRPIAFVLAVAAMSFPATVTGTAWTSLMGQLFPDRLRGRVFGERNAYTTLASIVATLAAGYWLDRAPGDLGYPLLFLLSFVALMLSFWYLIKLVPDPPEEERSGAESLGWQPEASAGPAGAQAWRALWSDRPFVKRVAALAVMQLGLQLPVPLYTILFIRLLGLSTGWIGWFSVVNGLAATIASPLWGRLADRLGHARIFALSSVAFAIFPPLYTFAGSPWTIVLLQAVAGLVVAGFNLGQFNWLLATSPPRLRPHYLAAYNMGVGLTGFIGPMLGVWLYQWAGGAGQHDLWVAFFAASLLRLVGALVFQRLNTPR